MEHGTTTMSQIEEDLPGDTISPTWRRAASRVSAGAPQDGALRTG